VTENAPADKSRLVSVMVTYSVAVTLDGLVQLIAVKLALVQPLAD
jgi:hypothetical protein